MVEASVILTVNLGRVDRIPEGQGRCYVVGADEIAIFRQRDGRIFATQNRCPHKEGPLAEGVLGSGKIICPLHAHEFNLKTGAGQGQAAAECLRVYPVREVDGDILLTLQGSRC